MKILGIGKDSGQVDRALRNVHVSNNTELPVLSGLPKDHKTGKQKNGTVGPVVTLSNILGDMLEGFVKELKLKDEEFTCKSTEELLNHFESYNVSLKDSDVSMSQSRSIMCKGS